LSWGKRSHEIILLAKSGLGQSPYYLDTTEEWNRARVQTEVRKDTAGNLSILKSLLNIGGSRVSTVDGHPKTGTKRKA
jgi:hypothetical protein